jgi:1,4-dihydroxy-2-naphthoyl-CoA synthase
MPGMAGTYHLPKLGTTCNNNRNIAPKCVPYTHTNINTSFCCVIVGLQEAAQMIMTGKTLKADKAKKAGLVDLVVDPACLESAAIQQVMHMIETLDFF